LVYALEVIVAEYDFDNRQRIPKAVTERRSNAYLQEHLGRAYRQLVIPEESRYGKIDQKEYDRRIDILRKERPYAMAQEEARAKEGTRILTEALNGESIKEYEQDPWSRRGLERARELGVSVPLGYSQRSAIGDATAMFKPSQIGADGQLDGNLAFAGGGRTFNNPRTTDGVLRHEGSHTTQVAVGEEWMVRMMDQLYQDKLGGNMPNLTDEHAVNNWKKFSQLMQMAKMHSQNVGSDLPGYEQTEKVKAEDIDFSKLSVDDKFTLLNSAGAWDSIDQYGLSRDLPHVGVYDEFVDTVKGLYDKFMSKSPDSK
jgi:hypothetical protein